MKITYSNEYIKVESEEIQKAIDAPEDYTSIEVTANKNCCSNKTPPTGVILLDDPSWKIDMTDPTVLGAELVTMQVKNLLTGTVSNILESSPIDMGYVEDNCVDPSCNLETFAGYFEGVFKTAIDAFFTGLSIASNVTVLIVDNTLSISDLPENYILTYAEYGASPYTSIPFGYGSIGNNLFLGYDGVYLKPEFFGDTTITDGVYEIGVKVLKNTAGYTLESTCAFVDITIKCKVAEYLSEIVKELEGGDKQEEQVGILVHTLHYALVNGSNCGCNCIELCQIYRELIKIIYSNLTTEYCGC